MSEDRPPAKVKDDDLGLMPEGGNPLVSGSGDPFVGEDEPKKRRTRSDAGKPRGPRRARASTLSKKISAAVAMFAAGVAIVEPFDSAVILHNADKLGNAWAPVVEQNPKIAAFFNSLEKGGVWGNAVFSSLSVALPILLHHVPDRLPSPIRVLAASLIPPQIHAQMASQAQAAANGFPSNGNGS